MGPWFSPPSSNPASLPSKWSHKSVLSHSESAAIPTTWRIWSQLLHMACPEPPVVTQFSSPTFSPARTPTCIRPPAAKLLPVFHKQPCSLLPLCLYTNTSALTTLFSLPTKIIILHNPTQASVPLAYHPSHTESALSWVPLLSSLPQLSHLPSIPALIPLSHNCVADAVQNMGVHICVCRIGGGSTPVHTIGTVSFTCFIPCTLHKAGTE